MTCWMVPGVAHAWPQAGAPVASAVAARSAVRAMARGMCQRFELRASDSVIESSYLDRAVKDRQHHLPQVGGHWLGRCGSGDARYGTLQGSRTCGSCRMRRWEPASRTSPALCCVDLGRGLASRGDGSGGPEDLAGGPAGGSGLSPAMAAAGGAADAEHGRGEQSGAAERDA